MAQINMAPTDRGEGTSVGVLLAVILVIGTLAFLVWALALDGVGGSSTRYPAGPPTAVVTPLPVRP
jgi:hypothetical protein